MQIFEALELREFPYFLTVDVEEGEIVEKVIMDDLNSRKVYLLIDHDTKRIWTYNGPNSSLKLQVFGGILAGMFRKQLRLFYRIYSLNFYSKDRPEFQEVMDKPIGAGRARSIDKKDFSDSGMQKTAREMIIRNPRLSRAMENINLCSKPEDLKRIFIIVGGIIYSEEEVPEAMLIEEKSSANLVKMGRLNNGFTLFDDRNYSTRIIVKDRVIQGIELFVRNNDEMPSLRIKSPIIHEDKISEEGDMEKLITSFEIPDSMPDIEATEGENQNKNT
ncbi:MAG: hypothetical protein CEE42_03530 [Promethearchaeota archaeon Loki_b31]|nr:MAG: hypothetical protein CEE42_03530 [Candidatus Lokiarchaeota archaeon Loki_b31]